MRGRHFIRSIVQRGVIMDIALLLAFLGTAVLLTLSPGPDILFVTAQSIAQNAKAGVVTAFGLCTGLLVHMTAAAAGISAVIYQSAFAFSIVKYAGALYLFYLAWKAFRDREQPGLDMPEHSGASYLSLYRKGIIMNLLNPKVALFFLALLPQFIHTGSGPAALQVTVLGGIFIAQAFLVFGTVSLLAHQAGRLLANHPGAARKMNLVQALLFTIIGVQLVLGEK
ncbi:Threonine/homoserine/homoserine lactone efflux protein [Salibacterium halotolerans]|uniref:Threonine/homoserine/homoserine lactone efflux protein n=2 Tax=Salibacterium halotolerans TaxID=1884432 RepID=A0A1I5W6B3_9BACI|nr:Threonine/homoserine/homoserine lactone efflux protein [Salibacterium halotolerans]